MTREMFGTCHHTHILHAFHILYAKPGNFVFIFSKTPVIYNRIVWIVINIYNRCIINMNTHSFTLFGNYLPVFINNAFIFYGAKHHLFR